MTKTQFDEWMERRGFEQWDGPPLTDWRDNDKTDKDVKTSDKQPDKPTQTKKD